MATTVVVVVRASLLVVTTVKVVYSSCQSLCMYVNI